MQQVILKINKGAVLADEHYRNTGHNIEVLAQKIKTRHDEEDFVQKYKCSNCPFVSFGGSRLKQYI